MLPANEPQNNWPRPKPAGLLCGIFLAYFAGTIDAWLGPLSCLRQCCLQPYRGGGLRGRTMETGGKSIRRPPASAASVCVSGGSAERWRNRVSPAPSGSSSDIRMSAKQAGGRNNRLHAAERSLEHGSEKYRVVCYFSWSPVTHTRLVEQCCVNAASLRRYTQVSQRHRCVTATTYVHAVLHQQVLSSPNPAAAANVCDVTSCAVLTVFALSQSRD